MVFSLRRECYQHHVSALSFSKSGKKTDHLSRFGKNDLGHAPVSAQEVTRPF
ncbi:hypothetical protein LJR009_004979 [Bosea sp. LjRoot9]|uniref:hypothetical protein n=1 Tax=Bosea sp. LjRoot9 TaxID=3342341 RepID=UPI003ECC3811